MINSQMLQTHQQSSIIAGEHNTSNQSLLFGEGGKSFTSNLTKRLAAAMMNHSSKQNKWLSQIEKIKA